MCSRLPGTPSARAGPHPFLLPCLLACFVDCTLAPPPEAPCRVCPACPIPSMPRPSLYHQPPVCVPGLPPLLAQHLSCTHRTLARARLSRRLPPLFSPPACPATRAVGPAYASALALVAQPILSHPCMQCLYSTHHLSAPRRVAHLCCKRRNATRACSLLVPVATEGDRGRQRARAGRPSSPLGTPTCPGDDQLATGFTNWVH